jgi:hypothetical protein
MRLALASALLLLASNLALANSAVLDLLQINSAVESLDPTINVFVKHQVTVGNLADADANAVRNKVKAQLGSSVVNTKLERYLSKNTDTALNRDIERLLSHPLASRVKSYQQKLAQTPVSKVDGNMKKMRRLGYSQKRSELIKRLNKALPHAKLAAIEQNAVENAVAKAIGQTAPNHGNRSNQLEKRVDALNHYTYRFFSDQQLEDCVTRLEQDDIQRYVKLITQGLTASL